MLNYHKNHKLQEAFSSLSITDALFLSFTDIANSLIYIVENVKMFEMDLILLRAFGLNC